MKTETSNNAAGYPGHIARTPEDVCANNHGGNEFSREANRRTNKAGDTARILAFMRQRPGQKTYVKEVIRELGLSHQTASARLSDLKASGTVVPVKGERAEGCGIVRLVSDGEVIDSNRCRTCGREIIFLKHKETGKPAPIIAEAHPNGNLVISKELGMYRVATEEEKEISRTQGKKLYLNHFADCPDAGSFRKP